MSDLVTLKAERLAKAIFAAGCCGSDPLADAREVLRYLNDPVQAEEVWADSEPSPSAEHSEGMGCWCHPFRDTLEPNVIIHRKAERA